MSTVLHPVGPQRARVYWVRRLVVVLLLVLLATVGWAVASRFLGGGEDASAADAAQPASDDAAAAAGEGADDASDQAQDPDRLPGDAEDGDDDEAAPAAPVDCLPDALQVTLTASGQLFDAATNPVLTATVTNVGDVPCTVDAGDANREVLITSGPDRIWSSKDCASPDTASRQLLLGAGAADSVEIEWARSRTAEGCPADLPAPRAGTYQAVTTLGTASSVPVVFALQ